MHGLHGMTYGKLVFAFEIGIDSFAKIAVNLSLHKIGNCVCELG
jgi:hypothetical protein